MEIQQSPALKFKLQEFIENTRDNIESKSHQIYSIIESMKAENDLLVSKCKS